MAHGVCWCLALVVVKVIREVGIVSPDCAIMETPWTRNVIHSAQEQWLAL